MKMSSKCKLTLRALFLFSFLCFDDGSILLALYAKISYKKWVGSNGVLRIQTEKYRTRALSRRNRISVVTFSDLFWSFK